MGRALNSCTTLTRLHIDIFQKYQRASHNTELQAFMRLAHTIEGCKSLTTLVLRELRNRILIVDMRNMHIPVLTMLLSPIANCKLLTTLNLSTTYILGLLLGHNYLQAVGAIALAPAIGACKLLSTLNLSMRSISRTVLGYNYMTDRGASALSPAIRNCKALTTLILGTLFLVCYVDQAQITLLLLEPGTWLLRSLNPGRSPHWT